MNKNDVVLAFSEDAEYPSSSGFFRPDVRYPEYPFGDDISEERNEAYELVRKGFYLAGFDRENYGKKEWNPLADVIRKGETVLLKPNLVMHKNLGGYGEECLYTHPAVVAAAVDYVYLALGNSGKIVIADAPMQECDFAELVEKSGYGNLIGYYQQKNINVELVDLRNKVTVCDGDIHKATRDNGTGIIIDLVDNSAFKELSVTQIKRLRITNYDPNVLLENHNQRHHKYCIAPEVLDADVVINMPKPKTHRKAGVTIAQKNLIGVNAGKEYLPHHSLGSKKGGGDAYRSPNFFLALANVLLDLKNVCEKKEKYVLCRIAIILYKFLKYIGKRLMREKYFEGSWYGNDTIWRTIKDINYIVDHADKEGIIQTERQRRQIVIADLIVAGEGEGPLMPEPHKLNTVVIALNNLTCDKVICSLMGIDYRRIPSICQAEAIQENIISNRPMWDDKRFEELYHNMNPFVLPAGWSDYIDGSR